MKISGVGAGGGAAGGGNGIAEAVKGMTTEQLGNALKSDTLGPEMKQAALGELINRALQQAEQAKGAEQAGQGQGEEDEMQKLLKKLQDGTISPAELQKLAKMLGIDPQALQGMIGKGGGAEGGGASPADAGDIR